MTTSQILIASLTQNPEGWENFNDGQRDGIKHTETGVTLTIAGGAWVLVTVLGIETVIETHRVLAGLIQNIRNKNCESDRLQRIASTEAALNSLASRLGVDTGGEV